MDGRKARKPIYAMCFMQNITPLIGNLIMKEFCKLVHICRSSHETSSDSCVCFDTFSAGQATAAYHLPHGRLQFKHCLRQTIDGVHQLCHCFFQLIKTRRSTWRLCLISCWSRLNRLWSDACSRLRPACVSAWLAPSSGTVQQVGGK